MGGLLVVLFLFVDALVFCVVGAFIAREKNREMAEGALLGFLLGPLGVIVEGLLPTRPPSTDASALTVADVQKVCPACAELIKAEAHLCRFCGHQFPDADVGKAVAEAEALLQRRTAHEREAENDLRWPE